MQIMIIDFMIIVRKYFAQVSGYFKESGNFFFYFFSNLSGWWFNACFQSNLNGLFSEENNQIKFLRIFWRLSVNSKGMGLR